MHTWSRPLGPLSYGGGGVDILSPFPKVIGGYHFLYVAIDKFTKWPEATTVATINKASDVKFPKSIVCLFGIPDRIITDQSAQFKSKVFQEYFDDININVCYTSVAHPGSNNQVERANIEFLKGLKT
jgi:transposase InsO family protein